MTAESTVPARQSFADEAFAAAADSYAGVSGSWELAIQSAIVGLFRFLADRPDQTNACIAEDFGSGTPALARRDHTINRFVKLLSPGFAAADAPPPVVAEAIGGGIYEVVRSHVLERRLAELPAAAPNAMIVALSPFVGFDDALELAAAENVHPNSDR